MNVVFIYELFQKIDDIENTIISNFADNFNTSRSINLLIELINIFNKSLKMVTIYSFISLFLLHAF